MRTNLFTPLAWALAAATLPSLCSGATARLDDYSQGMDVDLLSQRPIVQLSLPDAVYQHVVSDDLSDLAVFNADGTPVPHALCAAPTSQPPNISQE